MQPNRLHAIPRHLPVRGQLAERWWLPLRRPCARFRRCGCFLDLRRPYLLHWRRRTREAHQNIWLMYISLHGHLENGRPSEK